MSILSNSLASNALLSLRPSVQYGLVSPRTNDRAPSQITNVCTNYLFCKLYSLSVANHVQISYKFLVHLQLHCHCFVNVVNHRFVFYNIQCLQTSANGNRTLGRWTQWRWILGRQSPKSWTLWRQYHIINTYLYVHMDSQKQLKLCRFPQRTCKLMRLKVVI